MLKLDYHYGNEAEQYTFYKVPKVLIKDPAFKTVSCDAKLLYGLMLDRLSLSLKNGWRDEQNRVYIYYTLEDVQDDVNCSHGKGVKLLAELDGIGLIHRIKQGQGKPAKIYVKRFTGEETQISRFEKPEASDVPKIDEQTAKNEKPTQPKAERADLKKAEWNYNDLNDIDFNDTEVSPSSPSDRDGRDTTDNPVRGIADYTKLIKRNICYDDLAETRRFDVKLIDDFVDIMVDVVMSIGGNVRINGEEKPRELVKSTLLKIGYDEMGHAIDQFKGVTDRISRKRQYIISLLYNCKLEMDAHYTNLVRHDMYN